MLKERPYLDPERVGVWGWSGGGSMTLNALFRYPDIYAAGVSVAPVPNQLYYDTIYQERYMGLPSDNEEGYRLGSPITFADKLQGELLLIHGTGDDNCHYQTTELLINELVKHNKSLLDVRLSESNACHPRGREYNAAPVPNDYQPFPTHASPRTKVLINRGQNSMCVFNGFVVDFSGSTSSPRGLSPMAWS